MLLQFGYGKEEKTTWLVSYIVACVSIFYLVISAIDSEELVDALILGCLMIIIIAISFVYKSKRWFLLSTCTRIYNYLSNKRVLAQLYLVGIFTCCWYHSSQPCSNKEIRKQKVLKTENRLVKHFKK